MPPSRSEAFTFQTKLIEPPKDVDRDHGIEHEVDVAENGNQKSFYSVKEERLPVKSLRKRR
jgi:hypothetical protein